MHLLTLLSSMWSPKHEANYRLQLAVEDRFLVLRMYQPKALLPCDDILEDFAGTLRHLSKEHVTICDLRGFADSESGELTYDAIEFIRGLEGKSYCIATAADIELLHPPYDIPVFEVNPKGAVPNYIDVNLAAFARDHDLDDAAIARCWRGVSRAIPTKDEYEFACDLGLVDTVASFEELERQWPMMDPLELLPGAREILGKRYLQQLLTNRTRNSLLHEFALQIAGDQPILSPYHAHALNTIEVGDDIWIAKPAVFAQRIRAAYENELVEFENLIQRNAREGEIQDWLERHPEVFNRLGYAKIFPRVVLERDEGGNLIPDFILQPCDDDWCDVLDIKRPEPTVIVGPADRKHFSSAVTELRAQLREYSAYFDDPKLAKRVEKKYGIKCYKPKLIGVIGRRMPARDSPEIRRLMTSYQDAEILTFDRLIKRSRNRLLI